jgi:hypothetical protein
MLPSQFPPKVAPSAALFWIADRVGRALYCGILSAKRRYSRRERYAGTAFTDGCLANYIKIVSLPHTHDPLSDIKNKRTVPINAYTLLDAISSKREPVTSR